MTFRAKRGTFAKAVSLSGAFFALSVMIFALVSQNQIGRTVSLATSVIMVIALLLILWIWFDSCYKIDHKNFYYRTGPFRGKIMLQKIKRIKKNTFFYVGMKPKRPKKGLTIEYNKFSELYIAPLEQDLFIEELLKKNANIEIVEAS